MKYLLAVSLLILLKLCPNPYGSDKAEFVEFYCDSNCMLSNGKSVVYATKGYHIATKNKTVFYKHFGKNADIEFPGNFSLVNRGCEICLIDNSRDCFYYGRDIEFLDEGVVYYKTENGWDFRYEDWSDFKPVSDFVVGRIIVTPCNYTANGILASSRNWNVKELYVDARASVPCKIKNVYFLKSKSYKRFHYSFAVDGDKVAIATENWRFTGKGYIVEFKSEKIAKTLLALIKNDRKYKVMKQSKCKFFKKVKTSNSCKSLQFRSNVTLFVLPDENPVFDFISSAKNRLYIEVPYIKFNWYKNPSPLLESIKTAKENGADVLIVLDSRYSKDDKVLKKLRDIGAKVRFLKDIHGKAVVSDDRVLITSANFDLNGLKLNREIALIIKDKDVADFVANNIKREFNPIFALPSVFIFTITLFLLIMFRR